jgi:hypothetical protein
MTDDDTGRYRRRISTDSRGVHMTGDDRDLDSQRHRRKITAVRGTRIDGAVVITSESQAQDVDLSDLDRTPVFDLVDEVERARPLTVGEGVRILRAIERKIRDTTEDSARREHSNMAEIHALLSKPPPPADVAAIDQRIDELGGQIADARRDIAPLKRIVQWVGASALAVLVAVGTLLYTRGGDDATGKLRLELLERAVEHLGNEIRTIEQRHSMLSPAVSPDAISSAITSSTIKDSP